MRTAWNFRCSNERRPVAAMRNRYSRPMSRRIPRIGARTGGSSCTRPNPPAFNNDLKLLRLSDRRTTPLVASRFSEYEGRVAPDGRWLAYTSEETGRPEVYVRAFPEGTSSVLISIGGGSEASWRRDGQELFYVAPQGGLMAVALTLSGQVKASRPTELFRAPIPPERRQNGTRYASSADGRRFLIPVTVGETLQTALSVVLNWPAIVQR